MLLQPSRRKSRDCGGERRPEIRHLCSNGVETEQGKQTDGGREEKRVQRMGQSELRDTCVQLGQPAFVLHEYIMNIHVIILHLATLSCLHGESLALDNPFRK